jgi:LEA14-like dessication related protein
MCPESVLMIRRLSMPLLVTALVITAGTAGCIAQPTVTVEGVQVGMFTPANTSLQVHVRVTNPNAFDIPVQDVSFTIHTVEGAGLRKLGEGRTGPMTLPAGQTISRAVPVILDNEALLEAALVTVRAGQDRMTFRVRGTVTGDLYGVVQVDVPFEHDQTVLIHDLLGAGGVPVDEAQVRQVLGVARGVANGGIPAVTIRFG